MNIYVQICVLHLYIFAPSHVTQARGLIFNKDLSDLSDDINVIGLVF